MFGKKSVSTEYVALFFVRQNSTVCGALYHPDTPPSKGTVGSKVPLINRIGICRPVENAATVDAVITDTTAAALRSRCANNDANFKHIKPPLDSPATKTLF